MELTFRLLQMVSPMLAIRFGFMLKDPFNRQAPPVRTLHRLS
ncbi:hypothetical protein [Paenibacillus sp. 32O-W]|nr:hypothetical protein [Paenibacillus sp. 32O-W]